jgi:hypothetical protein
VIARSGTGIVDPREWRAQAVDVTRSSTLKHKRVTTSRHAWAEVHDVLLDDEGTVGRTVTAAGQMRAAASLGKGKDSDSKLLPAVRARLPGAAAVTSL